MKKCQFLKCSIFIIINLSLFLKITNNDLNIKVIKYEDKNSLEINKKNQIESKAKNSISALKVNSLKTKEKLNKKLVRKEEEKTRKNYVKENIKETNLPLNDKDKVSHEIQNNNKISERVHKGNSKTIATETSLTNNNSESKIEKTSLKGFINIYSGKTQSVAGGAFFAFVGGFVLFYLSILFICNNERARVVEAKYVHWINSDVKYVDLNSGSGSEKDLIENKPILIEGILIFYLL